VLVVLVLAYGSAIILSWRLSRRIVQREGRLWRWYGVVGLGVIASVGWQTLPSARSYYKPYYAVSESMAPTLLENDRLIAKMTNLPALKRGDIVIVLVGQSEYVMRLAGLPADSIAMVGGTVVLNGKAVAQRALGEWRPAPGRSRGPVRRLREQFPGEARPHDILDSGAKAQDDMAEQTLGQGEYFVLGDNRDHASDSRFPLPFAPGIVTQDRILGQALFRWWRAGTGMENGPL